MGIIIPGSDPEILDDKWYLVTSQGWNDPLNRENCQGNPFPDATCCVLGIEIRLWRENELDCKLGVNICAGPLILEWRLANIVGPFDTMFCVP